MLATRSRRNRESRQDFDHLTWAIRRIRVLFPRASLQVFFTVPFLN